MSKLVIVNCFYGNTEFMGSDLDGTIFLPATVVDGYILLGGSINADH